MKHHNHSSGSTWQEHLHPWSTQSERLRSEETHKWPVDTYVHMLVLIQVDLSRNTTSRKTSSSVSSGRKRGAEYLWRFDPAISRQHGTGRLWRVLLSHSRQTPTRQCWQMVLVACPQLWQEHGRQYSGSLASQSRSALWARRLTFIKASSLEGRPSEVSGSIQISDPNCQSRHRMSTSSWVAHPGLSDALATQLAHASGSSCDRDKPLPCIWSCSKSRWPVDCAQVVHAVCGWTPGWTSTTVLLQIPIQGKRNPPALFVHRSHPRTVQAMAAIGGKPVPSRIGARGAGWCCTSKTDSQRVSASFFLPVARSDLTWCSKSILAAACKMGSLVWTAALDGIDMAFRKAGRRATLMVDRKERRAWNIELCNLQSNSQ